MLHSFEDVFAVEDTEWKEIPVLETLMPIVSRTSNRIFSGLPLCRDPEYIRLNIDYTVNVFTRASLIKLFPEWLKPVVAPILSNRKSSLRHALKSLRPILEERLEMEGKYGREWADRPNDLISWLLDLAPEHERTPEALAMRILAVNIAAIHTSSTTLAAALFDLAAYPEHIESMREEASEVISREGWTKAALNSMHKIDSFLRESQRLRGTSPVAMTRKVMPKEGFTFEDGTHIPQGAFLNVVATSAHLDSEHYADPQKFDGFRFSRMREERKTVRSDGDPEGTVVFNRQMISTAPEHVVFGHGIHACPGRFFAATELKAMLAHIVLTYEIKSPNGLGEEGRPKDMEFGFLRMPNQTAKLLVKRRAEVYYE